MADEKVREVKGPGRNRVMGPRPKIENPGKLLKRLLAIILKNYWVHLIFVVAAIIVSTIANVQGTLFTQSLIDDYIAPLLLASEKDFTGLDAAIARVAVFYAIGIISTFAYGRIMIYVTQGTLNNMRKDLFTHMEKLPISYFDTRSHGDIMSIFTNDVDAMRQMISQSMVQMFSSLMTLITVFISMIMMSWALTIVSVIMVVVIFGVTGFFGKRSSRYFTEQQRNIGKVNAFIEEMMEGQKVVKVFCHEKKSREQFTGINEALYTSAYNANAYAQSLGPINAQLGNLSYVVCVVIGGILAFNGITGLTVGRLASFLTLNRNFAMPINQVSQQFNSIIMALAGAERIFALMDAEPETDEGYVTLVNAKLEGEKIVETKEHTSFWAWKHIHQADGSVEYVPLTGDVVFDDVDFGYVPEKTVLHNIDMFATPGQKIAFVGSTGAGKTTITNLINRFYDISDGKIRYDGININKIKKDDLRHSLGIVLQETNLFTDTVRENIRFGNLEASDEGVIAAAKLANAHDFIMRLPKGYDTLLTGNGANLSQGQRQLIAIARAAIADPPVLILDEATSTVDTRTERIVQEGMDKLMKGRTTFVIAHRLSTVRNSDCIMVLEAGRIIERGSHDELIEKKGKYYQLYTGKPAQA